jgi:hypothetical protein
VAGGELWVLRDKRGIGLLQFGRVRPFRDDALGVAEFAQADVLRRIEARCAERRAILAAAFA